MKTQYQIWTKTGRKWKRLKSEHSTSDSKDELLAAVRLIRQGDTTLQVRAFVAGRYNPSLSIKSKY